MAFKLWKLGWPRSVKQQQVLGVMLATLHPTCAASAKILAATAAPGLACLERSSHLPRRFENFQTIGDGEWSRACRTCEFGCRTCTRTAQRCRSRRFPLFSQRLHAYCTAKFDRLLLPRTRKAMCKQRRSGWC